MLAHDWSRSWAALEPALESLLESVCEQFPAVSGQMTRSSYGDVYFAARLYFMRDPIRDEHELLIFEVEVRSDVGARHEPPHLEFNPADPGLLVLDIWIPDEGSLLRRERPIPSWASDADIERVASGFFGEVVTSIAEYRTLVLAALARQLGSA